MIDIEVTLTLRLGLIDTLIAYDGVYVALAEALDAPLLTCDSKLPLAHGHHDRITAI